LVPVCSTKELKRKDQKSISKKGADFYVIAKAVKGGGRPFTDARSSRKKSTEKNER